SAASVADAPADLAAEKVVVRANLIGAGTGLIVSERDVKLFAQMEIAEANQPGQIGVTQETVHVVQFGVVDDGVVGDDRLVGVEEIEIAHQAQIARQVQVIIAYDRVRILPVVNSEVGGLDRRVRIDLIADQDSRAYFKRKFEIGGAQE